MAGKTRAQGPNLKIQGSRKDQISSSNAPRRDPFEPLPAVYPEAHRWISVFICGWNFINTDELLDEHRFSRISSLSLDPSLEFERWRLDFLRCHHLSRQMAVDF